ncbi:MAG: 2-amino-4-hydroxy-6-hydroxymethyldihydropteridine diphosphokinase [Cocleimonas sp.]|jgi:2-amino-4-hydroxy-6-hydroxymethyldihydropteridine diphosphokinase
MKLRSTNKIESNNLKVTCYVALGSNMGDSHAYLQKAIKDLKSSHHLQDLKVSPFYKSKPHGPQDQPDYLNAAVSFASDLEAEPLLDLLQKIENDNDRVREGVIRWGARTLDLDLLFYSDKIINTKRLIVPHPRICERAFVLFPLRDLIGENKISNLHINQTTSILNCIDALSTEELNNIKELSEELSDDQSKD